MKRDFGWVFAVGTLVLAACGSAGSGDGDGDGDNFGSSRDFSAAVGGGSCGKGELDVGTGELAFCAPEEADRSCPSTDQLVGYTSVNGDLSIYPGMNQDLSAASCLLRGAATLSISGGSELTSLKGLEGLESVRALEVVGMDKLTSLSGLDKLRGVNSLTISVNYLLSDIGGLPNGFTIGSLYVNGNPELTSLDGLDGITVTDLIAFENNVKLSSCKAAAFAKRFPSAQFSNFGNLTEVCN